MLQQDDTRSTLSVSVPTKPQQQNDPVLTQNTNRGGVPSNGVPSNGRPSNGGPPIILPVGHDWNTKFVLTDTGKAYTALNPKRTWVHGKMKLSHDQKSLVDKVSNYLFTMTNDPHKPLTHDQTITLNNISKRQTTKPCVSLQLVNDNGEISNFEVLIDPASYKSSERSEDIISYIAKPLAIKIKNSRLYIRRKSSKTAFLNVTLRTWSQLRQKCTHR